MVISSIKFPNVNVQANQKQNKTHTNPRLRNNQNYKLLRRQTAKPPA